MFTLFRIFGPSISYTSQCFDMDIRLGSHNCDRAYEEHEATMKKLACETEKEKRT